MKLINYENKKVKIIDDQGGFWKGIVTDYIYPEDNDSGVESIILKCDVGKYPGKFIEFTAKEITSIVEI